MNTLTDKQINELIKKASNKPPIPEHLFAVDVIFDHSKELMTVKLKNGHNLTFSLDEFPSLKNATPQQRDKWEFIGKGVGVHWEGIDEDLSVKGFINSYIKKSRSFIADYESVA